MKQLKALALAVGLALMPFSAARAQVPVSGPTTHAFTASGQSNVFTCTGGQSSFALTIPSGLVGTWTVTVSQTSAGTYVNPPWAYTPGSATYTNTLTNSGSLTVNLGSNGYVKVADTAYTSGSATITGVCTGSVAVVPPQVSSVTASSPLSSSGGATPNITFSGVLPCANGGTNITAGLNIGAILTASGGCAYTVVNPVASGSVLASAGTGTQPAYTTAPTISTTNFVSGCTTYTPTDASGASLPITVNEARYCMLAAKMIWVSVVVTYPTTASVAAAQLSLPVAASASGHSRFATTISLALSNGITAEADSGGNVIFLNTINAGGANANSTLSTGQVGFAGVYQTI
jgi:hypothetical protein